MKCVCPGKEMGITDFIDPNDICDKPVHEVQTPFFYFPSILQWKCLSTLASTLKLIVQVIREMTDGGVDYSFECTGINDVLREAFLSTHDVSRCAMPSLVRPSINNIARVHYMAQLDPDHLIFLAPFFSTPTKTLCHKKKHTHRVGA